jgi:hypothetical protein
VSRKRRRTTSTSPLPSSPSSLASAPPHSPKPASTPTSSPTGTPTSTVATPHSPSANTDASTSAITPATPHSPSASTLASTPVARTVARTCSPGASTPASTVASTHSPSASTHSPSASNPASTRSPSASTHSPSASTHSPSASNPASTRSPSASNPASTRSPSASTRSPTLGKNTMSPDGDITDEEISIAKMHINNWRKQEKLRVSISYIYETQFHSSYLDGSMQLQTGCSDGIIVQVAKILHVGRTHYATVKTVIKETILCLKLGEDYEPERRPYVCLSRRKILEDSLAMHLITCIKSRGASFKLTAQIYNALVTGPQNLPPVYYSAIYRAITESNHKVTRTLKRCQASDRNTMWRQARFNSCAQLLVRLGGTIPSDTNGAVVSDPSAVDPKRIKEAGLELELEQIGW